MSAENLAAVAGVLDIIEKNRDRTEPSVGISARLGEILEYTDNNFGGECSVNMLCEKFFISRSSLYRAFRDRTRYTPLEIYRKPPPRKRKKAARTRRKRSGSRRKKRFSRLFAFYFTF